MEIYGEIFLKNSILQYDVASLPCSIWYDGKFSDYKIPPWCLYAIGMTSCRSKSSSCLPDALRYLDNVALSKSHHNDATPLASPALFRCYDKCGCQTGSDPTKKMVTDDTTQTFLTKNYSRGKPSDSFAHFRSGSGIDGVPTGEMRDLILISLGTARMLNEGSQIGFQRVLFIMIFFNFSIQGFFG